MPPVILKRRHTLKGKNLIPLVRKMKSATGGRIQTLARVKSTLSIEEMTRSEVISAFREITGEDEKEILELAQREVTDANLRHLLHFAIVHANEVGQPAAQNLQPLEQEDNQLREGEEIQPERAKVSVTATRTLTTEKEVEKIKEKVRLLVLQNPVNM
ncbi:uncharacterized protein LOC125668862 [Ostrea edulis]|uniref:uncharacterized protein LOC125668862 n=1 Tax=Ostrea edulis TaxID=37623 RepID=UPI0024AEF08D|nr:uncharacterized protein LOC125668862 [Ostrea edulis]